MSLNTLNDQMKHNVQDYRKGLLMGTVVNNSDPLGTNRFQVQIPGLYEDGELPWLGMVKTSPFGIGPGFGVYGSPALGALAIIELQDGDAQKPICHGFSLHVNAANPAFASPDTWGFVDPSGSTLLVNTATNTWSFTHASGTKYVIDADGNLTVDVVGNCTINVNGNTAVNTQGNTTIATEGSTTITSGDGTEINTTGDTNISSSGSATVSAPEVTVDSPNTTMTGMTTVEGLLRVQAGIVVTGDTGSGVSAEFQGNVNHTNGLFVSNNVSISGHIHGTPEGNSGPPIAGT